MRSISCLAPILIAASVVAGCTTSTTRVETASLSPTDPNKVEVIKRGPAGTTVLGYIEAKSCSTLTATSSPQAATELLRYEASRLGGNAVEEVRFEPLSIVDCGGFHGFRGKGTAIRTP